MRFPHAADGGAEAVAGGVGDAEDAAFGNPAGAFVGLLDSRDLVFQRFGGVFDEQVSRKPAQIYVGISRNKIVLHNTLPFCLGTLYHK